MAQSLGTVQVTGQGNRALPNRNGNSRRRRRRRTSAHQQWRAAGSSRQSRRDGGDRRRHSDHSRISTARPTCTRSSASRGDQNNTTFNGLGSGISALPPDILATTSISPIHVRPREGRIQRRADRDPDDSRFELLAARDDQRRTSVRRSSGRTQTAAAQGQQYTFMRLGGNAAGPIALGQRVLQLGVQRRPAVQRRSDFAQHQPGRPRGGWRRRRIRSTRLLGILRNQHIPPSVAAVPTPPGAGCRADLRQRRSDAECVGRRDIRSRLGAAGNYPAHAAREPRRPAVDDAGARRRSESLGRERWRSCTRTISGSACCPRRRSASRRRATRPSRIEQLPEGTVRVSSALPDGSASVQVADVRRQLARSRRSPIRRSSSTTS